jgi:hypothetical protein
VQTLAAIMNHESVQWISLIGANVLLIFLGKQEIRAYGNAAPLQTGMTLRADVVLEQRSSIS